MLRSLVYILATVLVISLLRSILGVLGKAVSGLFDSGSASAHANPRPSAAPVGGELKRDPVCGVYVSTAVSVKKQSGGETLHFCSEACRDKHGKSAS